MTSIQYPIQLIVQYYRCSDAARQEEIDTCLRNNLQNPLIATVHLLTEVLFDFSNYPFHEKIVQSVIGERLTFERAFHYANEADPVGARIWILSNADIYFDDTLSLVEWQNFDGVIYALTRHDVQADGSISLVHPQYAHGSQDVWIFRNSLPLDRMFISFCLGIPGCDHRIAHEFIQAGYVVLNPSMKIIARHLDLARDFDIDARTTQYMALMTEECFKSGKAASPPYQVFLYPTERLSLSVVDVFRNYLDAAASIKKLEDSLNDRNNLLAWRDTQLAEQRQTIEAHELQLTGQFTQLTQKDRSLAENERHIASLYAALKGRDEYIASLKTSLSWKLTAPLRKVHTFLNRVLGRQPESPRAIPDITSVRRNDYLLSLIQGNARAAVEPHSCTVDVLLPVYNGYDFTMACVESVLANSRDIRLIVIDDASPDERIRPLLAGLKNIPGKNIEIIVRVNERNMGFVKTINKGFSFTANDFVILNTDTEVPPGWLDRLFAPLFQDDKIATITPFSNAATICSFPNMGEDNPLYLDLPVDLLDSYFEKYASREAVDIPTGIGFCMAFRRSVVKEIGFFNEEVFGRGYGEENDFCMRVRRAGYRNVMVPDLFVFHKHGGSFCKTEKESLVAANLEKLIGIYPEYPSLVGAFIANDPLKDIRDTLRLLIASREHKRNKTVAVIDFDLGGGSGLYSAGLVTSLTECGHTVIHLKYSMQTGNVLLSCVNYAGLNLALDSEVASRVGSLLTLLSVDVVIINQLVSWPEPLTVTAAIEDFGIPYLVLLHDYFYICPNWVLLDVKARFCAAAGDMTKCVACLKSNPAAEYHHFYGEALDDAASWQQQMYRFLLGARKVVCFSGSSQAVLKDFYPKLTNTAVVEHAVPESYLFIWQKRSYSRGEQLTVGIIGGIGIPKGIRLVVELLDNAIFKELPINIVVLGNTSEFADGYRSPDGKLFVYGKYSRSALPELLEKFSVSVILIPSVWSETFSFTTSEAILLGYPVICFDIGAQAERVKQYQCGMIVDEMSAKGLVKTFRTVLDNPELVEAMSLRTQHYVPKTAEAHFDAITSLLMAT